MIVPADSIIRYEPPERIDPCHRCGQRDYKRKCAGIIQNACGMAVNPVIGERLKEVKIARDKPTIRPRACLVCEYCGKLVSDKGEVFRQNHVGTVKYHPSCRRRLKTERARERYEAGKLNDE